MTKQAGLKGLLAVSTAAILTGCISQARVPAPVAAAPAAAQQEALPIKYPNVPRGSQVDTYHGVQVADPYRDLEQLDAPATQAFVAAQNALSRPYLEAIPAREGIKQRLMQLWNYERYTIPVKEGGKYFFRRNDGLQNQAVLYVAESLDAPPRVLLDPNTLSSDGTVSMADFFVSRDGKLLAYGVSDGGTDWKSWRVREVATGRDLPDTLRHTKFTDISWTPSGEGFYYSRYPLDAAGRGDDGKQAAVYFHRIGTTQQDDPLVYAVTDHPTHVPYGVVSEDGRYLILKLDAGTSVNGIDLLPLGAPDAETRKQTKAVRLFEAKDASYEFLSNRGTELFFATTAGTPNGSIVAVDVKRLLRDADCNCTRMPAIRTVVGEAPEALTRASYVGGRFLVHYLKDARSRVRVFNPDGRELDEVKLPGVGTAAGFDGHSTDAETFFSYTDYLSPPTIYRYEVATNRAAVFRRPAASADTAGYVTEQVFYKSKDGTTVPMFITHRRNLTPDGGNLTLLYGYGGFNSSRTPEYAPAVMAWLQSGGVYAVANLRGGGEYGEAWHQAGARLNKQNVFDDFIAAAQHLIQAGYTSPRRLAISGRSNGGLLVGAVLAQRPDLFGAALPEVGVLDMLRYQTASGNARQWSGDYGLSEVPEEFKALHAYSPYHHVENAKPGACYPPTLVSTGDHDDRVVPWHSYKFTAALQRAQSCANPILLRVETRAGHGAGKPTWMQIEAVADQYAFLLKQLGMAL